MTIFQTESKNNKTSFRILFYLKIKKAIVWLVRSGWQNPCPVLCHFLVTSYFKKPWDSLRLLRKCYSCFLLKDTQGVLEINPPPQHISRLHLDFEKINKQKTYFGYFGLGGCRFKISNDKVHLVNIPLKRSLHNKNFLNLLFFF